MEPEDDKYPHWQRETQMSFKDCLGAVMAGLLFTVMIGAGAYVAEAFF